MSRCPWVLIGLCCSAALGTSAQETIALVDTVRRYDYTGKTHFPMGTFDYYGEEKGDVITKWYDSQLAALNEPPIFDATGSDEIYRFTWLRTWGHPIAVRLTLSGDSAMLLWKRTDGAGGYYPGQLTEEGATRLTAEQVRTFRKSIADLDFWDMPTQVLCSGRDGAHWILEARTSGNYHITDRWTPRKRDPYKACCMLLLEYSNLKRIGFDY